ncbi:MAG: hypothetical protein ACI389_02350 [Methanobrevibacter sp.]|uniref:hypothetical protein n=1 Tax=Methanobrevibacter sp. TaxID=66852 RepID=UPI003F057112
MTSIQQKGKYFLVQSAYGSFSFNNEHEAIQLSKILDKFEDLMSMHEEYNGRWLDLFNVTVYDGDWKQFKNKIELITPCMRYYFTREQWKEFKEKVNSL